MLGHFLRHANDAAEDGVFLFQIWIFNCKMLDLLVVVFVLQILRIVQIFNRVERVSSGIGIGLLRIANKLDADAFVALFF